MGARTLVVAAHADDEVLGCGGTIAALVRGGHEVAVLILTQPAESLLDVGFRYQGRPSPRWEEAKEAAGILGVSKVLFEGFLEVHLDMTPLPEIVGAIRRAVLSWSPMVVYLPHWADLNQDHRRACEAGLIAVRPPGPVRRVLAYRVDPFSWPGGGSAGRGLVVMNIEQTWLCKQKALEAYVSELRPSPHPRSVEYLRAVATQAGASWGLDLAEVAELIWEWGP